MLSNAAAIPTSPSSGTDNGVNSTGPAVFGTPSPSAFNPVQSAGPTSSGNGPFNTASTPPTAPGEQTAPGVFGFPTGTSGTNPFQFTAGTPFGGAFASFGFNGQTAALFGAAAINFFGAGTSFPVVVSEQEAGAAARAQELLNSQEQLQGLNGQSANNPAFFLSQARSPSVFPQPGVNPYRLLALGEASQTFSGAAQDPYGGFNLNNTPIRPQAPHFFG